METHAQNAAYNFDFDFTMPAGQGNTASGYFDEGIDTTTAANASIFDQQSFDSIMDPTLITGFGMDQPLTLDNTLGGAWTTTSFPTTPAQSFNAAFTAPQLNSAGKRPLQLDLQDFPLAKRHESVSYSPFTASASVTGSSWAVDTQTPPSSLGEVGLSDEAADVCATWFSKYNVLPSDRHIDSLAQLTGESSAAIRNWFGQALKQGMTYDSAYKSQTSFTQQVDPVLYTGSSEPSDAAAQALFSDPTCNHDTQAAATTTVAQTPLRGGRKGCNPTNDPELLRRDPNKIYQCTRKCGKRYGRKCDWKRNEEEGYPSKSWICALCVSQGDVRVKPCFRKYHFSQHFRNIHPGLNYADYEQASVVESDTDFPKKCGFCPHRFTERQDRIDHIAEHFKQGKCMLDWTDDEDENIRDSDNSDDNDDDNDRPDGGDFGNNQPFFPPNQDQHGGPGSENGGSGGGGGSSGSGSGCGQQPTQGGYFQFQLAQSPGAETTYATAPCETAHTRSQITSSLFSQQPLHGRADSAESDHSQTLAGDAFTQFLTAAHSQEGELAGSCHGTITNSGDTKVEVQAGQIPPSLAPDPPLEINLPDSVATPLGTDDPVRRSASPLNSQSFLSLKLLGTGGFSTVDEVIHRETSLRVSRKTLKNRDPTALEELKKEVNVLQKLRHPHIVRFLEAYAKGDKMSILLSPVADTTLATWLERPTVHAALDLAETIVKMLGCLSSTVRYLHEQRPVVKHMDIKPQNILVMTSNQDFPHVVLTDFGISSIEETDEDGKSRPITRQYCAPEVSEGISRDQAADIWSLGCVFAEMATAAFSESNPKWLDFRQEYRGRDTKYYWQDVHTLHHWLSQFLQDSKSPSETVVVRTVKAMLDPEPSLRPDAAKLTMTFTPAPCCLSWPNEKVSYPGPREESASVEMLIREDSVDCHAHFHLPGDAADSQNCDSVAHAKSWLDECTHTHHACRQQPTSTKALPTRLVDIRPDEVAGGSIRIVNGAQLGLNPGPIDYVSLGYLWDQNEPTLSTDRLKAMQDKIPRDVLPRALNEAINAADRIGYRYIWVDSLCVLQDSEEDKERECLATAAVYRNSALTIVLDQLQNAASNQGADGIEEGVSANVSTSQLKLDGTKPSPRLQPAINFQTPGFGWDTRAWALQERFLSPRHLHLGEQQMYWECNALKASETFPRGLPPLLWEKVHAKPTPVANAHQPFNNLQLSPSEPEAESKSRRPSRTAPLLNASLRDQQWVRGGDVTGDRMEGGRRLKGRVGPLSREQRRNAALVRLSGGCRRCKPKKAKGDGVPCKSCFTPQVPIMVGAVEKTNRKTVEADAIDNVKPKIQAQEHNMLMDSIDLLLDHRADTIGNDGVFPVDMGRCIDDVVSSSGPNDAPNHLADIPTAGVALKNDCGPAGPNSVVTFGDEDRFGEEDDEDKGRFPIDGDDFLLGFYG